MLSKAQALVSDDAARYTQSWIERSSIHSVALTDGRHVRYVKTGSGPNLILTHTVRTQLDLFQFVVPLLATRFTVYAIDLPGFGWSDISPTSAQDEPTLRRALKDFISILAIERPTLVGESIGATLSLAAAADLGDAVARVVAFNTYDYRPGLERSNLLASVIIKSVRAPIVGPVFAALENKVITGGIMAGGFHDPKALPDHLLSEYSRVGARPGYAKTARKLLKSLSSFVEARRLYSQVKAPVTLVWGDEDWSTLKDRSGVEKALPNARVITLPQTGHFSSVERPDEFAKVVIDASTG